MKTTFSGWRYLWTSFDIRRKLLITLSLLALYRLAANIPAPGVDATALRAFSQSSSAQGGFLGFLDLLSGGTVSNFSILAMGVYPYITAQIILQLLTPIIPALQQRMEDDPREGRQEREIGVQKREEAIRALLIYLQLAAANLIVVRFDGRMTDVLQRWGYQVVARAKGGIVKS